MDRKRSTSLDSFHSLHFPPISSSFISLHFFSCRREEGKMRSFHNSPPLLCVRKGDALITGPQSSILLLVFLLFSFGWRRRLCYSNSKEVVFTFSPFLFGKKGCCLENAFQALFSRTRVCQAELGKLRMTKNGEHGWKNANYTRESCRSNIAHISGEIQ